MSISRQMDKEVVIPNVHTGILPSHKKNAFESVLMRWMNLEPIIQSKVSQKEKDNYHILKHIYRILKSSTEEFIYRAAMEKQQSRQWHPIPVLLPGEAHGWRSLVGYSPWGR